MSPVALLPGLWLAALAAAGAWALARLDGDLPRRVTAGALALSLAVLAGPLLAGRVLAAPELAAMPPFGDDVEAGRRALATEPAARVLPAQLEVRRAVGRGELPFWNPRPAAGVPLWAAPEAQVGQPLVMAAWPLPPGAALGAVAGLQLFVALVFGWLALRDLPVRAGPPPGDGAAFAGAAAYALPAVVPIHGWPEAHVAALFPALVYALGNVADRGRRRDHLLAVGVGAAVLLSGAPRAAATAVAAAFAFQLARLARRPPAERLAPFARSAGVALLALGLAAPVLVPALRWLPKTEAEVQRETERALVLREDPLGLRALRGTWQPPGPPAEAAPRWEPMAGAVLFFAALALVHGPVRRRAGAAWAVAAGAGAVAATAAAEPDALAAAVRYLRLETAGPGGGPVRFLVCFALAALAALGLTALAAPRRRRPGPAAVALAAVAAGTVLWAAAGPGGGGGAFGGSPFRAGAGLAAAAGATAAGAAAPLLAGLLVVETAVAAVPATVPARAFYPPHPVVAALGHVAGADRGLRSLAVGPRMTPPVPMVQGLADARGVPGQRPALYAELVRPLEERPGEWHRSDHPLYDLLAVHALLPPGPGVPQARPSALPLLFLPREARPVASADWLAEAATVDDFARTALVPLGRAPWRAAEPDAGRCAVDGPPGATRLAARCELAEERLLASSVYQDGGWRLLVDGRPLPATLANGPFVAGWLPAGEHRVELVHRPPGLAIGLACTAAAVAVGALWLGFAGRRRGTA